MRSVHPSTLDAETRDRGALYTPGRAQIATVAGEVVSDADPDALVEAIADRQRRAVARWQLLAAGLTRSAIEHRVRTRRLHRVHDGVFLVGHAEPLRLALETAALLACGPGAVISHRSAGVIWGFLAGVVRYIDVLILDGHPAPGPSVRVHRTRDLDAADVRSHDGLLLTSPARTLLDLAGVLGQRELRWAVEEAHVRRLASATDVAAVLERYPRRRGAARLRTLVADRRGPMLTRSEAERRLLDLVQAARLPAPETNVRVHGFEVDALWRRQGLVVEVDGFAFHGSRAAFERDRRRDAALQVRRLRVVRVTWRQLTDEPEAVVAMLAQLLER